MIFEDKLVALLKNPGYTISQGYRLYEVDPYGLLYFNGRCINAEDPSSQNISSCSSDSKRSLDNYSDFNNNVGNKGLFNFPNVPVENIIDIYIDQGSQTVIFIQSDNINNYTRIYLSPYKQIERRTVTDLNAPQYFLIGQIDGFVATRTCRSEGIIYAIDDIVGSQRIFSISINITTAFEYVGSNIDYDLYAEYNNTPKIIDITYDKIRNKLIALSQSEILTYSNIWASNNIPSDTGYAREHRSITHDYINDLYIIGNLSGVGSAYDFRGPFRDLLSPNNILDNAAVFTIIKANEVERAFDVPYFTIDNIEEYRYPLIFPLDNPNLTPTLPYKTYCNISKLRFYDMDGKARLVGSDDFIYQVLNNYLTGEEYPESSYIHRALVTYSSYATGEGDLIDGVLSVLATADSTNAVSTDPNQISQWISFDYGSYVDPDCSKVLINDIKICHERSARCVGADNLIANGDFLEGLDGWSDLDNNPFPDPFDPDIWSESDNTITLGDILGIKQTLSASGLVDIRIKLNSLEPQIDQEAGLIVKFYDGSEVVYEEEITNRDLEVLPFIWSTDFAVEATAFSIELNSRAISAILDYILICDIQGEKNCKPGYEKLSYDSFIDNNGLWILASDTNNLCGEQPEPPALTGYDLWYNDNSLTSQSDILGLKYLNYNTLSSTKFFSNRFIAYTVDKRLKRIFWLDEQYNLHRASQINPADDIIIATLPQIEDGLSNIDNFGVSRLITYHEGLFLYCGPLNLVTGRRDLIIINQDGAEIRRTNLPNARILAIAADERYVYVSATEGFEIGGNRIYRYDIDTLTRVATHNPTSSVAPGRVLRDVRNINLDRRNQILYYSDNSQMFGLDLSNVEGQSRRITLDNTRFITINHFDIEPNGDIMLWYGTPADQQSPFGSPIVNKIARFVIENNTLTDLINANYSMVYPSIYTNSI